jgi:hypothetical protein
VPPAPTTPGGFAVSGEITAGWNHFPPYVQRSLDSWEVGKVFFSCQQFFTPHDAMSAVFFYVHVYAFVRKLGYMWRQPRPWAADESWVHTSAAIELDILRRDICFRNRVDPRVQVSLFAKCERWWGRGIGTYKRGHDWAFV